MIDRRRRGTEMCLSDEGSIVANILELVEVWSQAVAVIVLDDACGKTGFFLEFSLCLSRACLGKMFGFI